MGQKSSKIRFWTKLSCKKLFAAFLLVGSGAVKLKKNKSIIVSFGKSWPPDPTNKKGLLRGAIEGWGVETWVLLEGSLPEMCLCL
eukprot:1432317-Amphidinium_carterae.1